MSVGYAENSPGIANSPAQSCQTDIYILAIPGLSVACSTDINVLKSAKDIGNHY